MNVSVLDPTTDPDAAAPHVGQTALVSLREVPWVLVAGQPVQRLIDALTVARRIPTVGSVLDALRRPEIGDRTGDPVLPLVSADKLHC
jgi:hypothetical protein